jgi:phosphatidylserine decarboxylase
MLTDYLKTIPQYLLPKQSLTTFAGFMANITIPSIKNYLIRDFIANYNVNMTEAREENPERYACFNDFFIRHLKPECRPIANTAIVSPVDGCISEMGDIRAGQLIQAKGHEYSVAELLACDTARSSQFSNGCFATLYLSPKDYHRVHMPIDAQLTEMIYVPGQLFSVQPRTARVIPKLFARNERLVVFFETKAGLMAMVLVGATIVGAIGTSWHGDVQRSRKPKRIVYDERCDVNTVFGKAAEMGYFKLGSTVILLFADGERIQWQKGLRAGGAIQFGQAFAEVLFSNTVL